MQCKINSPQIRSANYSLFSSVSVSRTVAMDIGQYTERFYSYLRDAMLITACPGAVCHVQKLELLLKQLNIELVLAQSLTSAYPKLC